MDAAGGRPGAAAPVLSTRELTKRFGGHAAVDRVTLDVAPRALTSIIGPNGAGKTTFFNLIGGQHRPSEGRVLYEGRDITALGPAARARLGIGRSFQLTSVFPTLPVLENVRLAVQARRGPMFDPWRPARRFAALEERAREILASVRLEHKAGAPASDLGHGEQRKLEIAILLALEPRVLLLDEPTAGMAVEEVPGIIALIAGLKARRDRTILLVEHRIDMVLELSDAVAVLQDGRLIAHGPPEAVSRDPAVQAAYFGAEIPA